jgi:hypothetical protein
MSFSLILSVGRYGGFYTEIAHRTEIPGNVYRLCLGWISFDIFTPEIDEYLDQLGRKVFGQKWDEPTLN